MLVAQKKEEKPPTHVLASRAAKKRRFSVDYGERTRLGKAINTETLVSCHLIVEPKWRALHRGATGEKNKFFGATPGVSRARGNSLLHEGQRDRRTRGRDALRRKKHRLHYGLPEPGRKIPRKKREKSELTPLNLKMKLGWSFQQTLNRIAPVMSQVKKDCST